MIGTWRSRRPAGRRRPTSGPVRRPASHRASVWGKRRLRVASCRPRRPTMGSICPGSSRRKPWWRCGAIGYSVPTSMFGAPVIVRVHATACGSGGTRRCSPIIDGRQTAARQRVVDPGTSRRSLGASPGPQVMLYRDVLVGLGRPRARLSRPGSATGTATGWATSCWRSMPLYARYGAETARRHGPGRRRGTYEAAAGGWRAARGAPRQRACRPPSSRRPAAQPGRGRPPLECHENLGGLDAAPAWSEVADERRPRCPLLGQVKSHRRRAPTRRLADRAAEQQLSYADFLQGLLEEELAARATAATAPGCARPAFLSPLAIEQFDFRFRPDLKRQVVYATWTSFVSRPAP